jgi:branched-chain amino acid transport system substrate-binding protein
MADRSLKIAVAGPITGDLNGRLAEPSPSIAHWIASTTAAYGAQVVYGARQAVADLNESGGVLGREVSLIEGDDQCDPRQAVALANTLASDGVQFVAGHFCSGSSIAASEIYAQRRIVQISPASSHPKFTDDRAGPGVYRIRGRDDQQGVVAARYILENFDGSKIAVIDDKTQYGTRHANEVCRSLAAANAAIVLKRSVDIGSKEYDSTVAEIERVHADVVYFGGYHPEAALIKRRIVQRGLSTVLIGGDALISPEYKARAGESARGTLVTSTPDPSTGAAAALLVEKLKAVGIAPELYVLNTYAAVQTWAQAVSLGGSVQFESVVEALNSVTFRTVIGAFRFDEKGDVSLPPYDVYVWMNDHYQLAQDCNR